MYICRNPKEYLNISDERGEEILCSNVLKRKFESTENKTIKVATKGNGKSMTVEKPSKKVSKAL